MHVPGSRSRLVIASIAVVGLGAGTGLLAKPSGSAALSVPGVRHPGVQTVPAAVASRVVAERTAPDPALFVEYCVSCHNAKLKTAGLTLENIDLQRPAADAEVLEKVVRKVRAGMMPPVGRPRPDPAVSNAFVSALEAALDTAPPKAGRVPVHRLNRVEYVNAIRDLLALDVDGPALLPADNSGLGFDNNADVLSITPGTMARYMSAATKISRLALGDAAISAGVQVYRNSEHATQDDRAGDEAPFGTSGGVAVRHTFPLDGEYRFKIRLQRNAQANTIRGLDRESEIEIRIDHVLVKTFKVGGQFQGFDPGILLPIPPGDVHDQQRHTYRLEADKDLEVRIPVEAGPRLVTAAFVDPGPIASEIPPLRPQSIKLTVYFDDTGTPGVDALEIAGPFKAAVPRDTPSRRKVFVCRPTAASDERACARRILGTLARRAYRRTLTPSDIEPLMKLYELGRKESDFDGGIGRALEMLLTSPAFLLRIERDPVNAKPGTEHQLSNFELASRLSFFLWKSIPDDELLAVAARGGLHDRRTFEVQVRRMLADRRATRWMNDFVGQWLLVRNAQNAEPDPNLFPDFDDSLRSSLSRETELFFESQVRDNRSVLDLLNADYTFMNQRLAEHYGVLNVYGSHFRRVSVTNPDRLGLLGHASVLTVTSYAHRTSVVLRGKYILEMFLGVPPPNPPPNVPPLKENDGKVAPTSLKDRMEQHRSNPVCASCHAQMDPMGFAFEHFDATGKWRDDDGGAPIEAVSALADGTRVDGPASFRALLLGRRGEFIRTVTEKLLTYALGRGVEYYDAPSVRAIGRSGESNGYRWTDLIVGVVSSRPFQMRAAAPAESEAVARLSGNGQ